MARVNGIGRGQWEDERALESPMARWKREELVNWLGRRLASPMQTSGDSAEGYQATGVAARSRPDGLLLTRAGDGSSDTASGTLSGRPGQAGTQTRERQTSAASGARAAIPPPRAPPPDQPAPRAATPDPTHRVTPAPQAPVRQTEPARRAASSRTQQSPQPPNAQRYGAGRGTVAPGARDPVRAPGRQRGNRTGYVDLGAQWATGLGPGDQQFGQDDPATQTLRRLRHFDNLRTEIAQSPSPVGATVPANFSLGGPRGIRRYWNEGLGLPSRRLPARRGNTALAYLGSFKGDYTIENIDANNIATVRFEVDNGSDLASALRPPGIGYRQEWKDNVEPAIRELTRDGLPILPFTPPGGRRPMAETRQHFEWRERIPLSPTARVRERPAPPDRQPTPEQQKAAERSAFLGRLIRELVFQRPPVFDPTD